jgi:hypothetical protein
VLTREVVHRVCRPGTASSLFEAHAILRRQELIVIELLKAIIWPATILFLVFNLREPLTELITAIGQRATRFKILQFEVELAALGPASPALAMSTEALQQAVVQESGTKFMISGITKSAAADFALIALGADSDHAWLTSRLFLLSVLIDRNRVVRCIVFTGERGGDPHGFSESNRQISHGKYGTP